MAYVTVASLSTPEVPSEEGTANLHYQSLRLVRRQFQNGTVCLNLTRYLPNVQSQVASRSQGRQGAAWLKGTRNAQRCDAKF
jgi:hypothetical protein